MNFVITKHLGKLTLTNMFIPSIILCDLCEYKVLEKTLMQWLSNQEKMKLMRDSQEKHTLSRKNLQIKLRLFYGLWRSKEEKNVQLKRHFL